MAKRKDMKNLVARNGWYHFRGYVPKDLIAIDHPKERTFSLNTHDYTVAIQRRDEQRIAHTKWIAEQRARRDGQYTVLKDLTDAQILGFARAAYALMMPYVETNREAQAARSPDERNAAIQARELRLRIMETGAVEGSEITGVFEYYTNKVLEQRMVRIDSADTYSRLVARVGEAVIQNMREQIAAISGKPGTEINPLFIDVDTGAPRMNIGLPDGRPNAPARGDLSLQSQVDVYIDYLSNRQQSKNVQGSAAALDILVLLLGRQADVRTLQRKDFEDYKSIIMKLPPNAKKKYPKLSILKIVEIRKDTDGHLKPETINGYLNRVIAFRNWLVETEVVSTLPELRKYKVPDHVNNKTKRDIFSLDHMARLARSKPFQAEADQRSVIFWAFIIGFYQGIRQGEIAGLLHSDYVVINDVPCLRLHPDEKFKKGEKKGKPKTIEREVPIHRILIELGFHQLFQPKKGKVFVFEEIAAALAKNPKRARGDLISRKANKIIKSLGFSEEGYKILFHSTRHTFEDACKRCKLVDGADNIIGGWAGGSTKEEHYGSGRFELWMKEEIDKISYDDFEQLLLGLKK